MAEEIWRAQVSSLRMVEAIEVDIEDGGNERAKLLEGMEKKEAKMKKEKKEGVWEVQGMPEGGHALYNQSALD